MATSGSHKTEWTWLAIPGWLQFDWWIKSQSAENNTSTIGYSISFYLAGGVTTVNDRTLTVVIDGYKMSTNVKLSGETGILDENEFTISHNPNGTRSFSYSYELEWDVVGDWTPTRGGSSTGELDPINRKATITSASNFTDETNPVIHYYNPAENAATTLQLAMKAENGTVIGYRDIDKTGSSYTWVLTAAEKTALQNTITSSNFSEAITFTITTIIDNTTWYSHATTTFTLVGAEPTLSPIVTATDARTKELTGDSSGKTLIRHFSDVQFNTGASASKGAKIDHQTITNGSKVLYDYASNTGTIENVTSNTFYFSATDTRGLVVRDAVVFSVDNGKFIEYVKLTSSIDSTELTASGQLTFTIKGKYFNGSFGAKKNSMEVEFSVRDSNGNYVTNPNGSGWTILGTVTPTVDSFNNYTYSYTVTGLNYQEQYELSVNVIDEITPSISNSTVVSTIPIFEWSKDDFRFNVPVYLQGSDVPLGASGTSDGVDTIVEQSSDGTWYYRRWQSGRVELYGYQYISNLACNIALGGWYRTNVLAAPAFPFFITSPHVTASYESDGFGALVWATTQSTTDSPFDYYLIRPTSSTGITGRVVFHVFGTYKGSTVIV